MAKKHKILLVDDDDDVITAYSELLDNEGYEVITAKSAAMANMRAIKAELIILDLNLSEDEGGQGQDVLHHIWEDDECNIPIIVFSGYVGSELIQKELSDIQALYGKGRELYRIISKSSRPSVLIQAVNDYFAN